MRPETPFPRAPATGLFGVHLLFDGYGGDARRLADAGLMRALLADLPASLGMHALAPPLVLEVGPMNRKDPGGVSGFVMIAESHLSLHSFPARGFLTADVYTCQDALDGPTIVRRFARAFAFESVDARVVPRGVRYPMVDLAAEPGR